MSKAPLRLVIGSRTLVLVFNVVKPKSQIQKGIGSRFSLFFYRNNSRHRSRTVISWGPTELFLGAPCSGVARAFVVQFSPFSLRAFRLNFKEIHSPVKPFAVKIKQVKQDLKTPPTPKVSRIRFMPWKTKAVVPELTIDRKTLKINQAFVKSSLLTSHDAIFITNTLNAELIKDYESVRLL